ncbi:hypothetical protein Tco_1338010 [Tanacetum coccineum]
MYHQKNVDYVELLWEDFIYQIDNKAYKKKEKMYYPRFTKVIIYYFLTQDKTVSWRNKIGMHTSKDDYLINTLRFVSAKKATQIYSDVLPESLTSTEMKETKAYKTYLGFDIGATPLKKAQKFKKPASPQLTIIPVSPKEPTWKSKRVKRLAKTSIKAPARGVVIRETPERPLSKKKEKVDVARDGINNEQDSSGEDSDPENDSDDDKTQSNNENESDSEHETDENESGSESDQDENEEDIGDDEEEVKDELVKTPSNDSDDEDETKIIDKAEGDEDKEMDYTTSQLYDDMEIRLNEPIDTDKGFIQEEGTNAEITNIYQRNENPEISQVIEDVHVTISTVPQKTEVPVTSSSHSSDLAAKFLNFLDIPHTDAKIVSLMDVHVHHEVPSNHDKKSEDTRSLKVLIVGSLRRNRLLVWVLDNKGTRYNPNLGFIIVLVVAQHMNNKRMATPMEEDTTSFEDDQFAFMSTEDIQRTSCLLDNEILFQFNNRVTTLEKEVVELKKDPIHTQVIALVDDHLDARLGATRDEFMNFLLASLTARITEQMVKESLEEAVLAKVSSQPQTSYEATATLTEFELKKILINKMYKSESYLVAPEHRECYEGLLKSYDLNKTIFSTYGKVYSLKRIRKDKDKDEDPSAGSDRGLKKRKTSKDTERTKVQSEEPEFEVADSDMPQDQEENLGNDNEEPKEKVASKRDWFTKPTQPQEPTNPDWNSKSFDELMSTPIDFSAYIMNDLKITNLTQEIMFGLAFRLLKGTRSNYAELDYEWKSSKRVVDYFFNNDLKYLQGGVSTMTYTTSITKTKAALYDLPGIEDMVPNIWVPVKVAYDKHALWGISLWREQRKTFYGYTQGLFKEGDFPRLRINDIEDMILFKFGYLEASQDFQLGVESYQKKINVTKRETTKSGIRKRDPYTSRPSRIHLCRQQWEKQNIRIEYLPKRRWSTLEKKRANIMIKAIDKQLKERRMMRSLEKFVGGRHYGTDLQQLQRTI